MAVFSKEVELTHDQDFLLLQNGPINKYYQQTVLKKHANWLLKHKYILYEFNCLDYQNEDDILKDMRIKLKFPINDSINLDSFNDFMHDFEVDEKNGTFFIFHRFDAFHKKFPTFSWDVLDTIANTCFYNLLFGRRLIIFLQSNDPKLEIDSVGATTPQWNHEEWTRQDRGL